MTTGDAAVMAGATPPRLVRGCDGCTLCCKVMEVKAIAKPGGRWCPHCRTGVGCGIYETRPEACAVYVCGYLTMPALSPEWKPAVSRLIVSSTVTDGTIVINVDPARPDAWRRHPYFADLRRWSVQAIGEGRRIIVYSGGHSIVILPDHAVDLGTVGEDELIILVGSSTPGALNPTHEAYAVKRDVWMAAPGDGPQRKMIGPGSPGFRSGRRFE